MMTKLQTVGSTRNIHATVTSLDPDSQRNGVESALVVNITEMFGGMAIHGPSIYIPYDPLVNVYKKNYGKSPCSMEQTTISMPMFHSYVNLPQGDWGSTLGSGQLALFLGRCGEVRIKTHVEKDRTQGIS